MPQSRSGGDSLLGEGDGRLDISAVFERLAAVGVRAPDFLGGIDADGDLPGCRGVGHGIPGQPAEPGQRVEDLGLHQPVANRHGKLQRLLATLARLGRSPAQHQHLPLGGQDEGTFGARRFGRHQLDGGAIGGQRSVDIAPEPGRTADQDVDSRQANGVPDGVELGRRLPRQFGRAAGIIGADRGAGSSREQSDAIDAGHPSRIGHPIPQRQGALAMSVGLVEGEGLLGLRARRDRRRQRPAVVARREPMMSELGGHPDARRGELGAPDERSRQRAVELRALGGQQIAVHRLANEGVAEAVRGAVSLGDQDLVPERLSQGIAKIRAGHAGHAAPTAPSSRSSTARPAVAATASRRRAGGESRSIRTRSTSRSDGGSSVRAPAARSSSV